MRLDVMARAWPLALAGLALAGCVTPPVYGAINAENAGYGYRDARNADGSYTVLAVANTPTLAHEFWDRRAHELCGGSNFRKNIFRAEIPVVLYSGYASNGYSGGSYTEHRYGAFFLEGYLHCAAAVSPVETPSGPPADAPGSEAPPGTAPG
jgi:hypothetical protein